MFETLRKTQPICKPKKQTQGLKNEENEFLLKPLNISTKWNLPKGGLRLNLKSIQKSFLFLFLQKIIVYKLRNSKWEL
jgi:hypothetical protein